MEYLIIAIIVTIVCREIACWYFKINKTIELLEQMLSELRRTNASLENSIKIQQKNANSQSSSEIYP